MFKKASLILGLLFVLLSFPLESMANSVTFVSQRGPKSVYVTSSSNWSYYYSSYATSRYTVNLGGSWTNITPVCNKQMSATPSTRSGCARYTSSGSRALPGVKPIFERETSVPISVSSNMFVGGENPIFAGGLSSTFINQVKATFPGGSPTGYQTVTVSIPGIAPEVTIYEDSENGLTYPRPSGSGSLSLVGVPSGNYDVLVKVINKKTENSWSSLTNCKDIGIYSGGTWVCLSWTDSFYIPITVSEPKPACIYNTGTLSSCINHTQTLTRTATNPPCIGETTITTIQSCTPSCTYALGTLSVCDPVTRTQTKTEVANNTPCIGTNPKITTQSCAPSCTYTEGTWSSCSPITRTKTRTDTANNTPCVGDITKIVTEPCTPACTYTEGTWSTCDPATSLRTRTDVANNTPCNDTTLKVVTEPCIPVCTWSPLPMDKCSGETFTQTSDCGTTREEVGTATCISDTGIRIMGKNGKIIHLGGYPMSTGVVSPLRVMTPGGVIMSIPYVNPLSPKASSIFITAKDGSQMALMKACFSEGESLGPLVPEYKNNKCCPGLVVVPPPVEALGVMGTCEKP